MTGTPRAQGREYGGDAERGSGAGTAALRDVRGASSGKGDLVCFRLLFDKERFQKYLSWQKDVYRIQQSIVIRVS